MEVNGILVPWFETGTEGFVWTVSEDNKPGYQGMKILENGDELVIYDERDMILFQGKIEEDSKIGWMEHYPNAGHGQPIALGYWIHWTQKGYIPDDWAQLFFHGHTIVDQKNGIKPYRAKLKKRADS